MSKLFISKFSSSQSGFNFFGENSGLRQQGFTLVELMISIVIIVILTTIGIASFNSANARNGLQQQAAEIRTLARKLRTDAGAAIKPNVCVTNSATVAGTYISFTSGPGGSYSYGVVCFSGNTPTYSTTTASLPTGYKFGSTQTILFPFSGGAGNQASTPALPSDYTNAAMSPSNPYQLNITDGTNNYYVYFNSNGLVCEQKDTSTPTCAG